MMISLEFKKNKKFIIRILLINIICLVLALVANVSGFVRVIFSHPSAANGIFLAGLIYFVIINLIFVVSANHRDFFKGSSIFTFMLPVSHGRYISSKVFSTGIVYLMTLVFLLGIYLLLGFRVDSNLVFYFVLGLIWMLIITLLVNYIMQASRFGQGRMGIVGGFVIALLSLGLGYVICKYFSLVLVNGQIQKAGAMDYAFVYPFAVGKYGLYKNFTPLIYYILVCLGFYILAAGNLEDKLDLS